MLNRILVLAVLAILVIVLSVSGCIGNDVGTTKTSGNVSCTLTSASSISDTISVNVTNIGTTQVQFDTSSFDITLSNPNEFFQPTPWKSITLAPGETQHLDLGFAALPPAGLYDKLDFKGPGNSETVSFKLR